MVPVTRLHARHPLCNITARAARSSGVSRASLGLPSRQPTPLGDFLGTILAEAHRQGLRVLARLDLSKGHTDLYAE